MNDQIEKLITEVSKFINASEADSYGDDNLLNNPLRSCCTILGVEWDDHILSNGIIEVIYGANWKVVGLKFIVNESTITIVTKK